MQHNLELIPTYPVLQLHVSQPVMANVSRGAPLLWLSSYTIRQAVGFHGK
jgi:hypothetical protein